MSRQLGSRFLAVVLSLSLVLSGPGANTLLAAEIVTQAVPGEALKFFEAHGVFKGPDDPLRTYVGTDKKLTPLGDVLYRYLKAQYNPAEELSGFTESFEALRKSGPYDVRKASAVSSAFARYQEKFGSLPGAAEGAEDTFRLGTLREAYMTGAAVADPPKQNFNQVALPDGAGWEFWDQDGLAFRLNKNQVTVYNRELQKQQRELNKLRPPQAPFIPETGRYNVQMLEMSYWRLKGQMDELQRAFRMDRMINMAELLGKQYKDDMWFKDLTLEADLEKWAKAKTYKHQGQTYSIYDIVETKTKNRRGYLEKGIGGLEQFKAEMEKLRPQDSITDQKLASMQMSEQYILRYLSLVFLESQRFYVRNQLERLDQKAPDHEMIKEAIKDSPMDAATKAKYREEGENLRKRLERLNLIFAKVQDTLSKSDYASSLDMVQAALNQSQKELSDASLDYSLYAEAPSMGMLTRDNTGSWVPTKGIWVKAFAASGIYRGHSRRVEELDKTRPYYDKMATLISQGKYGEARKIAIAMHPDASSRRMDLSFSGAVKVNDALKVSASLKQTRETLTDVTAVNAWVNTVGNFVTWTVSLALAAPLVSRVLTIAGNFAGKIGLNLIQEVFIQTATRLNSLSPAAENLSSSRLVGRGAAVIQYLEASGCRALSAGARQLSFTALSGVISGGFTALGHAMDSAPFELNLGVMKIGEGHSNFRGYGDAFVQGAEGGVHWANESFHPMLGYVGLPSSYFEGTKAAWITQTLGEKGVGETMIAVVKRLGVPISEKISISYLGSTAAGKIPAFVLGMADNVSKYALFSQGVGYVGKKISWHKNFDEQDVERRIKRASKTGMAWAEAPVWMLIPVFPAKYEEAAAGYQRSLQGAKEYLESSNPELRAKLANAAENDHLPLLTRAETPVMQKIFNLSYKGSKQTDQTFLVTKDIKRQAIAEELMASVPGGGKWTKLADINPLEFLKISQMDPKETPIVGNKLYLTDDVKFVAREKFTEVLRANQKLAEQVLAAKPGTTLKGFGLVTPGIQREVALTMHLEKAGGGKVAPAVSAQAAKLLDRYLQADNMGKPAESLMKAIRANKETGALGEQFKKAVKTAQAEVTAWKEAKEANSTSESYMDVLGRLKKMADSQLAAKELTPKQHEAIKKWYEYVDASEARFQSFNNVEATHALVAEELSALKTQYSGSGSVQKLINTMETKLVAWRDATPASARRTTVVEGGSDRSFKNLMSEFGAEVNKLAKENKLPSGDMKVLESSLRDMKASPWILHDSKGTALSGWRPGQFESLMITVGNAAIQGQGGEAIQVFTRLTTGGGKTLLMFEGLLPLVEADAAHQKREVSFLTVQSNLEAQARLEFLSLKKIGSKLKFDTYEGFKSQIAEAKNKGEKFVEKQWIMGDEMDGAALQPALTLGETTGRITRINSVYTRIEKLNEFMESLLGKRNVELAEGMKAEVRKTQSVLDGASSSEAKAARLATEKLLKAAEQLSAAKTPEALNKAQETLSKGLVELRTAMESSPLSAQPESMAKFQKLNAELKTLGSSALDGAGVVKLRSLLKLQQDLTNVSAEISSSGQAKAYRQGATELTAKVKSHELLTGSLTELRRALDTQPVAKHGEALAKFLSVNAKLRSRGETSFDMDATESLRSLVAQQKELGGGTKQVKAYRQEAGKLIGGLETTLPGKLQELVSKTAESQSSVLSSTARLTEGQRMTLDATVVKVSELLGQTKMVEGLQARSQRLKTEISSLDQEIKSAKGDKERLHQLKEQKALLQIELKAPEGMAGDFAATLVQQQNLLGLAKGEPKGRLEGLRQEAGRLREAAEAKLTRLNKELASLDTGKRPATAERKAALQSEIALTEKELSLARRFEVVEFAHAQKLIEKTFELQGQSKSQSKLEAAKRELSDLQGTLSAEENAQLSVYKENVGKLYDLGRRMAEVDGKILDAIKGGKTTEALKAQLEGLNSEAREVKNALSASRQEALGRRDFGSSEIAKTNRLFRETGEELLALVKDGKPGMDSEGQLLLRRRQALLEAYAGQENPAYEVYRKMKADAYSIARSSVLERDEKVTVKKAGEGTKALVDGTVAELKTRLEEVRSAKETGKSEKAVKVLQQAETLLTQQLDAWTKKSGGDAAVERAKVLQTLGEAMDLAGVQSSERKAFLKSLKGQQAGLEGALVTRLEASFEGLAAHDALLTTGFHRHSLDLKFTEQHTVDTYAKKIDGQGFWKFTLSGGMPKLLWQGLTGQEITVAPTKAGLSRIYAVQLIREIVRDPVMPAATRDNLLATLLPSVLMPKGALGRSSSYMRTEFINMVRGYYDNPAGIRLDGISGNINVIHNGQWFESMDNPTRRFWEVYYGTDITLPYTHKSLSTIKDLTGNKKARYISLSATAPEKYVEELSKGGVMVGGTGSKAPANVDVNIFHGETPKTMSIAEALRESSVKSKSKVSFRISELLDPKNAVPGEVKSYLEALSKTRKGVDGMVLELSALPEGGVRDYFTTLRQGQNGGGSTSLVVLSLSDTVMLKKVRNYLIKSGQLRADEIAQVFSDSEWLRLNRPEARVQEQMNLDGMPTGKVKILLLDTRVGGRGLDLDFKGERGNSKLGGFKGYTNYEMLVIDPSEMSAVHLLQAEGRIDLGRVLPGASRNFSLVMDVKTVQKDAVFKTMFNEAELFVKLRSDPKVIEFARQESARLGQKMDVDWAMVDSYVKNAERARVSQLANDSGLLEYAGGRTVDSKLVREYVKVREKAALETKSEADLAWVAQHNLIERYEHEIRKTLDVKQRNVEEDQLRSSSVLQDKPISDPKMRWLELLAR